MKHLLRKRKCLGISTPSTTLSHLRQHSSGTLTSKGTHWKHLKICQRAKFLVSTNNTKHLHVSLLIFYLFLLFVEKSNTRNAPESGVAHKVGAWGGQAIQTLMHPLQLLQWPNDEGYEHLTAYIQLPSGATKDDILAQINPGGSSVSINYTWPDILCDTNLFKEAFGLRSGHAMVTSFARNTRSMKKNSDGRIFLCCNFCCPLQ